MPTRCDDDAISPFDGLETGDAMSFFDGLETGDVLLIQYDDMGTQFIRCMLQTQWTHVGMVVRMPREKACSLYTTNLDYANDTSSTERRSELHILEAVARRGVSFFPLEPRMARSGKSIRLLSVRKLRAADGSAPRLQEAQLQRFESFLHEMLGRPLETAWNSCAPVAAGLHQCLRGGALTGWAASALGEDYRSFFCSEVICLGPELSPGSLAPHLLLTLLRPIHPGRS